MDLATIEHRLEVRGSICRVPVEAPMGTGKAVRLIPGAAIGERAR